MSKEFSLDDLYQFPSSFDLHVIGKNSDDFQDFVLDVIQQHVPDLCQDKVNSRLSRDGNYLAVTVVVVPQNKEQLDSIYRDLSGNERVLMVL
jgi:uncharacterized protein